MYQDGLGVPQDDTEAVKWYRKAARQGQADAQTITGYEYKEAKALRRTMRSRKMVSRGAQQGYADAQFEIGGCTKGLGVPQDSAEAANWYFKAARQGYAQCPV